MVLLFLLLLLCMHAGLPFACRTEGVAISDILGRGGRVRGAGDRCAR